jgi:hypothetical protein
MRLPPEKHVRFARGWVATAGICAFGAAVLVHWFVTPLVSLRMPLPGQIMATMAAFGVFLFLLVILDQLITEIVRQALPAACPLCRGRMYFVPQADFSDEGARKPVEYLCRDCGQRGELKLRYKDVRSQGRGRRRHRYRY